MKYVPALLAGGVTTASIAKIMIASLWLVLIVPCVMNTSSVLDSMRCCVCYVSAGVSRRRFGILLRPGAR